MKTKMLFIFLGGAATGALISFALLKEKCETEVQEEIKAMKEYYEKEIEEIEEHYEKEMDDLVAILDKEEKKLEKKHKDLATKYSTQHENVIRIKQETIEGSIYEEDDIVYDEDEEDEQNHLRASFEEGIIPDTSRDPYVISRQEFDEEMLSFDKVTLLYYDLDDTLTDEQDVLISDVCIVIGDDALSNFGNMSEDPRTVFIRNEKFGTDYEVIKVYQSYKESVLGIIEDTEEDDGK